MARDYDFDEFEDRDFDEDDEEIYDLDDWFDEYDLADDYVEDEYFGGVDYKISGE